MRGPDAACITPAEGRASTRSSSVKRTLSCATSSFVPAETGATFPDGAATPATSLEGHDQSVRVVADLEVRDRSRRRENEHRGRRKSEGGRPAGSHRQHPCGLRNGVVTNDAEPEIACRRRPQRQVLPGRAQRDQLVAAITAYSHVRLERAPLIVADIVVEIPDNPFLA